MAADVGLAELWNVYFLSLIDPATPDRDFGLVKVGITKNEVESRIEHLQTGNPYQLRCEASFPSPVARQVENWIHRTNAARVAQLEWLRLMRSEIPDLVKAAQEKAGQFADTARAQARWSRSRSNGLERPPSDEERRLHGTLQDVHSLLWPVKLRLRRTEASIALLAGDVCRVPGIVRIHVIPPSAQFSSRLALEKFPHLAAGHAVESVGGKFYWRDVPNIGSPAWRDLRLEVECLETQVRELNTVILNSGGRLRDEGERTDKLAQRHEEYLRFSQEETRLKVDEESLKAQMIQKLGAFEAISEICSFRRSPKPILNNQSFREAYPREAAECCNARPVKIQRTIYKCRSY
jgi:hypothetical protein